MLDILMPVALVSAALHVLCFGAFRAFTGRSRDDWSLLTRTHFIVLGLAAVAFLGLDLLVPYVLQDEGRLINSLLAIGTLAPVLSVAIATSLRQGIDDNSEPGESARTD